VVNTLLELLKNKNEDNHVKVGVIFALGQLCREETEVINSLVSIITDKNNDIALRRNSLTALAQVTQKEQILSGMLIRIIEDKSKDVAYVALRREALLTSLRIITISSKEAELIKTLWHIAEDKTEHKSIRSVSVFGLGRIGYFQEEEVNRLLKIAQEPELTDVAYNSIWEIVTSSLFQNTVIKPDSTH